MPDVVKVLHAQKNIALSDFVSDKVVLKTTAAGVTEVIKSASIVNPGGLPVTLRVGDYDVVNLASTGALEGWEVVPPSTEVSLALPDGVPKYWPWKTVHESGGTAYYRSYNKTLLSATPSGPVATNISVGTGITGTPSLNFLRPDNEDYYYAAVTSDAAATWTLYRRAGGVGGTQTTVGTMGGTARCTDGERYIFSITSGGVVYVCDTNTNTISSRTVTGMTGINNFSIIRYIEGRLFVGRYDSNSMYHFEAFSATTASTITLLNTTSPQIYPHPLGISGSWAFAIMKSGSTYYVQTYGYHYNVPSEMVVAGVMVQSLGTNLASPSVSMVGFSATTDPSLGTSGRHSYIALESNSIGVVVGSSDKIILLRAGQQTLTFCTFVSLTDATYTVKPTIAQLEMEFPDLTVRVVGVEQS